MLVPQDYERYNMYIHTKKEEENTFARILSPSIFFWEYNKFRYFINITNYVWYYTAFVYVYIYKIIITFCFMSLKIKVLN